MICMQRLLLFLLVSSATTVSAATDETDPFLTQLMKSDFEQRQQLLRQHFTTSSVVRWDDSESNLVEALRLIKQSHTDILLELGINEHEKQALLAFEGPWWAAVKMLCTTYDLEPAPPRIVQLNSDDHIDTIHYRQQIFGGPIILRQRLDYSATGILRRTHVSGPILLGISDITETNIRGLKKTIRNVDLTYHLRFEPQKRHDLVEHVAVIWRTAHSNTGETCTIRRASETNSLFNALRGDFNHADPHNEYEQYGYNKQKVLKNRQIRIDELPPQTTSIRLSGDCQLYCRTMLDLSVQLQLGDEKKTLEAPIPITCTLFKQANDNEHLPFRLQVTYPDMMQQPQIIITEPNGLPINHNRSNLQLDNGMATLTFHIRNINLGLHDIRIIASINLGTVTLPIDCTVELP